MQSKLCLYIVHLTLYPNMHIAYIRTLVIRIIYRQSKFIIIIKKMCFYLISSVEFTAQVGTSSTYLLGVKF